MKGAPREIVKFDENDLPNMSANLKEIWRNAQDVEHEFVTAEPIVDSMRNNEIKVGVVEGVGKMYVKMQDKLFSVNLTEL